MGWLHEFTAEFHKPNGTVDRRKCLDRKFNWTSSNSDGQTVAEFKVLKSAMVGSTYYAAVEKSKPGQKPTVSAVVCLTCGRTRHDGTEWGFKDMDETMGPNESKCPASILALLTPTDSKWANEWRERCRKHIAEAAERRKSGPKPLYAPKGVTATEEGRSWIITSGEYRATHSYVGVRFSKAKWGNLDNAMRMFLYHYGTAAQRHEYAESGRECPPEWNGTAA